MSEASDNIENIFLCGLGFFLIQAPFLCAGYGCAGYASHRSHRSHGFSFDGVKSHGGWRIGRGACPSAPISKAHTDPTDLTEFFF